MNRKIKDYLLFSLLVFVVLIISSCRQSSFQGKNPEYTSSTYIVDNIEIEDPCIVEKDSILYVVSGRSKINSLEDIPDLSGNLFLEDEPCPFYQVWYPFHIDQSPEDFFLFRCLAHPSKKWKALEEVCDRSFDTPIYYRYSFLSNLRKVWTQDGVTLYDFITPPKSFLVVLMRDILIDTTGFEGDLATDVVPIYATREYKIYVCPLQKTFRYKLI